MSKPTDHSFDHLVLRSDGTYDLIEGGETKSVSETKGTWRMEPGAPAGIVNVVLNHAGYPIELKDKEVRLLIDLGVGTWWVKAK